MYQREIESEQLLLQEEFQEQVGSRQLCSNMLRCLTLEEEKIGEEVNNKKKHAKRQ